MENAQEINTKPLKGIYIKDKKTVKKLTLKHLFSPEWEKMRTWPRGAGGSKAERTGYGSSGEAGG